VREFAFELRLCAHLEGERQHSDAIIGRQLGTSVHAANRVMDVVLVESGPDFDARTELTPHAVPDAAIESDVGVGRWTPVTDAFGGPPERARRLAERAVDAGFFERERRGGEAVVRQVARYPDGWFGGLTGVENKPDLGDPGDLQAQLRKDAALGLLDEVVLATESYVTGAHLNRIPDLVGVWRVDFDAAEPVEVVREPTPLSPDEPGVEIEAERPLQTDVALVSPGEKARARRRVAERAYGKGWRTHAFPGCAEAAVEDGGLPFCAWKERLVEAERECGPGCPGYEQADPADVNLDAERAERSAWVADPERGRRRQAGLDRFG
jgi:hypothetical protein